MTGSRGSLGQDVVEVFTSAGHEVLGLDHHALDITNQEQVLATILGFQPEVVINCAAYNAVDKVEEPEVFPVAYAINALGPGYLAEASKVTGAKFVHISSDYVFPGDKPEGYHEHDARGPISKYGETKAQGEVLIESVAGKSFIVRTSKLFGRPAASEGGKESFVSLMLRLAQTKPELAIVHEEVGSPTYTRDLAQSLHELVAGDFAPGVYHIVNSGPGVTWYEFAEEIFSLKNITTPRKPVTSQDFPKPAARPKFAALINNKFPRLRSRLEALKDFLQT